MAAYYNELDPFAAQWLRNLIAAGHIAPGDVDERDIRDVQASDLVGYEQCHFFAGIGGWSVALRLAGWPDKTPVWTGSLPCQPFSSAGARRGEADERHLWPVFFRLIAECRPATLFGEQVASLAGRRWLTGVRADLETLAYALGAADLCAAGVGAPHIRQRLYWVADSDRPRSRRITKHTRLEGSRRDLVRRCRAHWSEYWTWTARDRKKRRIEPGLEPLALGVACRLGRLRAYGNSIVPPLAAIFIQAYCEVTQ